MATATEKTEPRPAPAVTARSKGKVKSTLENTVALYKAAHPDRSATWVYDSATKPELSNIMQRSIDGYELVSPEAFGKDSLIKPFIDEKGKIRVGDAVLMSIPTARADEIRAGHGAAAREQRDSVQQQFEASMDTVTQGRHRAVARGAAKLEERDHQYQIEQRSQE